jgi:hypothetical protein
VKDERAVAPIVGSGGLGAIDDWYTVVGGETSRAIIAQYHELRNQLTAGRGIIDHLYLDFVVCDTNLGFPPLDEDCSGLAPMIAQPDSCMIELA